MLFIFVGVIHSSIININYNTKELTKLTIGHYIHRPKTHKRTPSGPIDVHYLEKCQSDGAMSKTMKIRPSLKIRPVLITFTLGIKAARNICMNIIFCLPSSVRLHGDRV